MYTGRCDKCALLDLPLRERGLLSEKKRKGGITVFYAEKRRF